MATLQGQRIFWKSNQHYFAILAPVIPEVPRSSVIIIRKWLSFCSQRQVDQIHPTVGVTVEFLARLYKNGLSCSSINSARSALSEILNPTHFSQWVMVSILMLNTSWKVFFKVGPLCLVTVRRGMLIWFSSALVPLKLVMLVALTTAQRSESIHLFDTTGVVWEETRYIFLLNSHIKQSKPGGTSSELVVKFSAFLHDIKLCVVSMCSVYLDETQTLKEMKLACLYTVTHQKPHKRASRDTIRCWIWEILAKVWGVITTKMRCCIMLFYYDLLHSTIIGIMSSLFGIVNSIRPFCILLYICTFYYVLYSAILTWRFRLLWWCFALSMWQCKILYPIVQFYILWCRSSKIGLLSEFWYSILRSHIMICLILWIDVVLCLRHILHGTQRTKIRRPSRGMGIILSHTAIFCHSLSKWGTMLIRWIEKKTSIDQGLKLLREAKELPSVSLSDNIPLVNSTSIPNPNRSERIVSNLLALFSVYDDSLVSTRRLAPQSRNQIAGPPKIKERKAGFRVFQASGNMDARISMSVVL